MEEAPQLLDSEKVWDAGDTGVGERVKVPVTIVTGFLGSGKTTLIMRILNDQTHGKRIAVILNEFGESAGIDKSLTRGENGELFEEWLELKNGCLCCSIKDNGVKAIENLMKQRGKFDYILLETTGLADPAPIANIFWMDEDLESDVKLDGIITVVDAKHILQQLSEKKEDGSINEATRQIALADRILVNKTDLVSQEHLEVVSQSIRNINGTALIQITTRSQASLDWILDIQSLDNVDRIEVLRKAGLVSDDHLPEHIDKSVTTVVVTMHGQFDRQKLDEWLRSLLWESTIPGSTTPSETLSILRLKAVVDVRGEDSKVVVQGVQELYELHEGVKWAASEARESRFVFIGRGLNEKLLNDSLLGIRN
ncbi:COBW domain-containing protein 1 [Cladochytrium replicatum]|nr:COBW domain-containing protein 1 [Cladochytrium replicatum]